MDFFRSHQADRRGLAVNMNSSVLQMTASAFGAMRGRWWHVVHLAPEEVRPRLPRPIRSLAYPRILRLSRIGCYDESLAAADWRGRFIGIGHPFHFDSEPWPSDSRIRLGLFGSPANYIDRLERLVGLLGPLAARADWASIGFVRDAEVRSRMAAMNIEVSSQPLDPAAYRRSAGSCHAGLWLNDPSTYECRASGSLVDALAAGRPVIGLDCGFNRTTLAQCGGAGRLAADVEGVAEILHTQVLVDGGLETLKDWSGRISEGRSQLSPEACGRRLREAWESGF
jgi:glycosyltransferase involved in cell wall biosynthesis